MRPLKVMYYLNVLRDGAGMINREIGLAQHLQKSGHDVTILSHFRSQMNMVTGKCLG